MSGGLLPTRSAGVRWTELGGGLLLHDGHDHRVHLLDPAGSVVWAACDGVTPVDVVVDELATATAAPSPLVRAEVTRLVVELAALGLVGRGDLVANLALGPLLRASAPLRSRPYRVLRTDVVLAAEDPTVLEDLDAVLGSLATPPADSPIETVEIEVTRAGAGVRVRGRGYDMVVEGSDDLAEAVMAQCNRVVTWATDPLALHAGAVRAPSGAVVAIAGPSGSGKSTLVAALVQAGWDYLTDEALGIAPAGSAGPPAVVAYPKPLALSAESRSALGLDAGGPLTAVDDLRPDASAGAGGSGSLGAVVVAGFRPGAARLERLGLPDAVEALCPQAINLAPAGQSGLDALALLLATTPVVRLEHGGGPAAVEAVASLI